MAHRVPEAAQPFRTQRPLSAESVATLHAAVDATPDLTTAYVAELQRIERFAKTRTGYAYPSWGRADGFTAEDCPSFLAASTGGTPNSSLTQRWVCSACRKIIANRALLRQCPACQQVGTLVPLTTEHT
jgi:hypothetical protein